MADFHQPRPSEQPRPDETTAKLLQVDRPSQPEGQVRQPSELEVVELARAHIANRDELQARCGQTINPRAFDFEPQGNRIVVAKDPVPTKIGLIVLTDKTQATESMGQGWVISAGPLVGADVPYPSGPICTPDKLIGRHIVFGMYTGKSLRFSLYDRQYKSQVVVMTDRDVWCVDWNPDPQAAEQQFEHDLIAHIAQVEADAERVEVEAAERLAQERMKLAQESGLGARKP